MIKIIGRILINRQKDAILLFQIKPISIMNKLCVFAYLCFCVWQFLYLDGFVLTLRKEMLSYTIQTLCICVYLCIFVFVFLSFYISTVLFSL